MLGGFFQLKACHINLIDHHSNAYINGEWQVGQQQCYTHFDHEVLTNQYYKVDHKSYCETVGNLKLLHSYALDLVGCLYLSLGISKSIVVEIYGYKNHY